MLLSTYCNTDNCGLYTTASTDNIGGTVGYPDTCHMPFCRCCLPGPESSHEPYLMIPTKYPRIMPFSSSEHTRYESIIRCPTNCIRPRTDTVKMMPFGGIAMMNDSEQRSPEVLQSNMEQVDLLGHARGPKPYTCGRCRNHGDPNVQRKRHVCPFRPPHHCEKCDLIEERRINNRRLKYVLPPMPLAEQHDTSGRGKLRRTCRRCAVHNKLALSNGHKAKCPYRDCFCEGCKIVLSSRDNAAKSTALRRRQSEGQFSDTEESTTGSQDINSLIKRFLSTSQQSEGDVSIEDSDRQTTRIDKNSLESSSSTLDQNGSSSNNSSPGQTYSNTSGEAIHSPRSLGQPASGNTDLKACIINQLKNSNLLSNGMQIAPWNQNLAPLLNSLGGGMTTTPPLLLPMELNKMQAIPTTDMSTLVALYNALGKGREMINHQTALNNQINHFRSLALHAARAAASQGFMPVPLCLPNAATTNMPLPVNSYCSELAQ